MYEDPVKTAVADDSDWNEVMLWGSVFEERLRVYERSQGRRFDPASVIVTVDASESTVDRADVRSGIKKGDVIEAGKPASVQSVDARIQREVFAEMPSPPDGSVRVSVDLSMQAMFRWTLE